MKTEAFNPSAWNPKYLEYCEAHGYAEDPEGMLAADKLKMPGAHMIPFILWATHLKAINP